MLLTVSGLQKSVTYLLNVVCQTERRCCCGVVAICRRRRRVFHLMLSFIFVFVSLSTLVYLRRRQPFQIRDFIFRAAVQLDRLK